MAKPHRIPACLMLLAACAPATAPPTSPSDPAAAVTRLADDYVARFFERSPEAATRLGLPADRWLDSIPTQ